MSILSSTNHSISIAFCRLILAFIVSSWLQLLCIGFYCLISTILLDRSYILYERIWLRYFYLIVGLVLVLTRYMLEIGVLITSFDHEIRYFHYRFTLCNSVFSLLPLIMESFFYYRFACWNLLSHYQL